MIDFRYHLVSLISVFLALAVGVVLGAGPLQNSIGTALQDQVSQLRTDRDAVRTQLQAAEEDARDASAFIQSVGPAVVSGTLTEQRVAVIALPGAAAEDIESVAESVNAAGGEVTARVRLTDDWSAPDRLQYRTTLAGQMLGYLDPAPPADAGTDGVLGSALTQALTGSTDPAQPEVPAATNANSETILTMLSGGEAPLVDVTVPPTDPAGSVVIIGQRAETAEGAGATASPSATDDATGERASLLATVRAIDGTVPATVVVGAGVTDTDLVSVVRADEALAGQVSTVDSVGHPAAPVTTALALATDAQGTVGHYGFDSGATAITPRVPVATPAATDAPAQDGAAQPAAGEEQSGTGQ